MNDFIELIEKCETLLRAGRGGEVAKLLQRLEFQKVPREARLPLARICRRSDLTTLGLKLLTPVIYPEKNGISEAASDPEWAEFAALRLKIGSVDEALIILSRVNDSKVTDAPMLRAFCHMAKWDYKPAAQELRKYLAMNPPPYQALIGRVNLAAALVSISEMDEALALLEALIVQTKEGGYDRLRANCYELKSQIHLERENNSQCLADLNAASEILSSQKTADQLYIQKWLAVMEARKYKTHEPLLKIKSEAFERHNWETVREMDFQILQVQFDSALYEHLYWGTPFQAYRERVKKTLAPYLSGPDSTSYRFGFSQGPCVDLRQAQVTSGELNAGKQTHRLLVVLLQDFYKPISVGALYADIFPGEYYNVFSSPDRVHQALRRGRRWLEKNSIPASIQEIDGRFKLQLEGPVSFVMGSHIEQIDSHSVLLKRLKSALSEDATFTSVEIAKITGMSKPSAVRFINWAIDMGHFEKQGMGRATRYCFSSVKIASAA